jgi:HEAT repeat protein
MKNLFVVVVAWGALLLLGCGHGKPQTPAGGAPPEDGSGQVSLSTSGAGDAGLLKALDSDDESARLAAIDALGQQGGKIEGAIPALVKQLGDSSATIRAHAARALGEIGPAAKSAAEPLAKLIFEKEAVVRREAVKAYRSIRPGPEVSIPLFTKLLEEAEPGVRLQVMRAMAEQGKAAVPGLIQALGKEKSTYWACLVLSDIGPDAQEAVPALIKVVQSDQLLDVRREAVLALAAIGPAAADAVPALIGLLGDQDTILDGAAVFALGAVGPKAKAAEGQIKKLAEDEKSPPLLKTVSLWALAKMNPEDVQLQREVVPRLVEALKAPDAQIRAAAARALLDLNPDPEILRPLMEKVMAEASPEALNDILDAVASLGEKAVPRLIKALEVEAVRPRAAAIIARIGPPAKEAVQALIKALADKNPETRNEVLFALAAIGPDAKEAVPAIAQALKDPDPKVCYAACYALGKIGPAAVAAKADLLEHLTGNDHFLCMAGAWALAEIDPKDPQTAAKVVPVLIQALEESDPPTRLHAAEALGLFGPLAGDAAAALKKLQSDPDQGVREAAAAALKAIGSGR